MSRTSPRIERAVALLDTTAPGWDRKINTADLDMGNSSYCIIGQVYGSFYSGLAKLGGEAERRPGFYGFMPWGGETFYTLTGKWIAYLNKRRREKEAA